MCSTLHVHVHVYTYTIQNTCNCRQFYLIITKKVLPVDVAQTVQLLSLGEFRTQQS